MEDLEDSVQAAPVHNQGVVHPTFAALHLLLAAVEFVVTYVADSREEFMPLEDYAAQILIAVIH